MCNSQKVFMQLQGFSLKPFEHDAALSFLMEYNVYRYVIGTVTLL